MTTARWHGSRATAERASMARILTSTSAARLPSLTTAARASRTWSSGGGSASSQWRQALASATMAARGWLISCAMEAASSPRVVTRVTRASSVRAWCRASSARLRSVMSLFVSRIARTRPWAVRRKDQRLATTTVVPSRRVWTSSPSQRPVRVSSAMSSSSGAGKTVCMRVWAMVPTASAFVHP